MVHRLGLVVNALACTGAVAALAGCTGLWKARDRDELRWHSRREIVSVKVEQGQHEGKDIYTVAVRYRVVTRQREASPPKDHVLFSPVVAVLPEQWAQVMVGRFLEGVPVGRHVVRYDGQVMLGDEAVSVRRPHGFVLKFKVIPRQANASVLVKGLGSLVEAGERERMFPVNALCPLGEEVDVWRVGFERVQGAGGRALVQGGP